MIDEEYLKSFKRAREMLLEDQAKMSEEERRHNREYGELINKYQQKYPEGLPFQMPYNYDDLKEAYETDRPLHTWEKYKGYYGEVPDDWLL